MSNNIWISENVEAESRPTGAFLDLLEVDQEMSSIVTTQPQPCNGNAENIQKKKRKYKKDESDSYNIFESGNQ